ncbi:uncharacterized protein TNCV_5098771 [Trichonephila clavipes]|uniref:Uncharacterized protein n=1 Tax=Trichonephila clavipes TaxID=2585209 RepID=A0A8X6S4U1_TRICX|nr:uncharacterized protein TNCV_5098771 [Trichonephila clavipes]
MGVWTESQSSIPYLDNFDVGLGESGVLHSALWHGGDWLVDGIREAWLTCFIRMDRVTAEIRERFQQLQNLAQKYAFLRPEVMLSMDELNLDQALQDINKEFQLERVRLQAFVVATAPGCKKELISPQRFIWLGDEKGVNFSGDEKNSSSSSHSNFAFSIVRLFHIPNIVYQNIQENSQTTKLIKIKFRKKKVSLDVLTGDSLPERVVFHGSIVFNAVARSKKNC